MERMKHTENSYTYSNNNKEISIPLVWIILPLIIFLIIGFPFNISAIGSDKAEINNIQFDEKEEIMTDRTENE